MLWAWERPEDLRALPPDVGVAFLAQTITIGAAPSIEPRRQPLRVDPGVPLVAVTRIENPRPYRPALAGNEREWVVAQVMRSSRLPGVRGVQVDFDAVESQRTLYLDLLRAIRAALADDVPISITALASWCAGDRWLDQAAVDEIVPMLFRMGPDTAFLRGGARVPTLFDPRCQQAVGVSLDEPVAVLAHARRVYHFNPAPWDSRTRARAFGSVQ
jgi:hypothetical protein